MNDARIEKWQHQFAVSTGQWAFVLSLSRRMVDALRMVRDDVSMGSWTMTWPTMLCKKRGLIEFDINRSRYFLTPAGECVVKLLEYAGLMSVEKIPKQESA